MGCVLYCALWLFDLYMLVRKNIFLLFIHSYLLHQSSPSPTPIRQHISLHIHTTLTAFRVDSLHEHINTLIDTQLNCTKVYLALFLPRVRKLICLRPREREREREKGRKREREKEREKERVEEREKEREGEREKERERE